MIKYNDQLNESLSSLYDGAGTNSDIDEVLSHDTQKWQDKMQTYALTSAILKANNATDFSGYNLVGSVRQAIEQDESLLDKNNAGNVIQLESVKQNHLSDESSSNVWKKSFGSLALAASVAFVVISGGSYLLDGGQPSVQTLQASINTLPIDIRPLQQVQVEVGAGIDHKRLQTYLRQHVEQSTMAAGQGMLPMARVVSYPIGQE